MQKTAIQFSGGKDSLAVLYLNRDRLGDITVYFGDTGDVYPHMVEFVHSTCAKLGADLKVVRPPMPIGEYHRAAGLPADIIPMEAVVQMKGHTSRNIKTMIQGYHACCSAMLWFPLNEALKRDGIEVVLRGAKRADGHVGVQDGHIHDGITYRSPIWEWTDDDVFAYLKSVGAALPAHYEIVNNSFDCMMCTAYLTSEGARERLRYTKKHYPERWAELRSRLAAVRDAIDEDRALIDGALALAGE